MSYSSDDHTSSKTPFTGDQTGDIFADTSDLVSQSPITTVRTVETQSGFLVVLKDVEDRTSLSVKRKIGTPPQSHVLLTADEVKKLSRILSTGEDETLPPTSEFRVSGLERTPTANDAIQTLTSNTQQASDFSDLSTPYRKRKKEAASEDPTGLVSPRRASEKKTLIFGAASIGTLVVLGVVAGIFFFFNYSSSTPPKEAQEIVKHEMSSENVDTFVRAYVANLLDFSPRSYRYSQIQAMSVMSRELMSKYWTETNFPLSRRQLKRLPKNQTVMISKVLQEPTSSVSTDVDLYAELITSKSKTPSPVHLKLGISLNQDGKLMVISQKDVSSEDAKAKD